MEQLKLTEIQRDTLVFIRSYTRGNGYPPTLREMAKEFEVTEAAISHRLLLIEKKGYIARMPFLSRAITILQEF